MLGHHDVADDIESVTAAGFLQQVAEAEKVLSGDGTEHRG